MSAMADITTEDLSTKTEVASSEITVRLAGSAETAAMGELDALLKQVHGVATAEKIGHVIIDMRDLEFMSSSCFKTFVSWIGSLQGAPPESQYRVRFVASDQKHWQSRSLSALACFAVDLITLESS
jgi:hypothetical protein